MIADTVPDAGDKLNAVADEKATLAIEPQRITAAAEDEFHLHKARITPGVTGEDHQAVAIRHAGDRSKSRDALGLSSLASMGSSQPGAFNTRGSRIIF